MIRSLMAFVFLTTLPALLEAQGGHYQTGGAIPLPASLQERLDRHVATIRLGVNTDHLDDAKVSSGCYVRGLEKLASAVEQGIIPGAVVYLDHLTGENMPIGIGHRITDPEKHPVEWSTLYEVGDLASVLLVTPLALAALERGDLKLADSVREYLPEFADSGKGELTIEELLRHSTGLPERPIWPENMQTREDVIRAVMEMEFEKKTGTCVSRSPVNFLLLSLVLETIEGAPVRDAAMDRIFAPLGLRNTVGELPLGWRGRTAAGPYCPEYGRMMWGEPTDRAARVLGSSAGYAGLVTTADDLGTLARLILHAHAEGIEGFVSGETMSLCTAADERLEGGSHMGLGWELGRLGEGSFGWDAANGCSLWLDPRTGRFLILLTNLDHPNPHPTEEQLEVHRRAFDLLVDSLNHRARAVDAGEAVMKRICPLPLSPGQESRVFSLQGRGG